MTLIKQTTSILWLMIFILFGIVGFLLVFNYPVDIMFINVTTYLQTISLSELLSSNMFSLIVILTVFLAFIIAVIMMLIKPGNNQRFFAFGFIPMSISEQTVNDSTWNPTSMDVVGFITIFGIIGFFIIVVLLFWRFLSSLNRMDGIF
jgi:hypothetical protein